MDWAGLAKALAPGLGNLIGTGANYFDDKWKNPADAAMPYLENIPGQVKPYLDPYFNAGQAALPTMQNQYSDLLSDPGKKMNQIGQSYQQSPGLDFAIKQALQGAGHAAAAGGMAGSPQHQEQNIALATNYANQDYNDWMSKALGLYGKGLGGEEGLYQTGFGAGKELSDLISSLMSKQAELSYQGADAQNKHDQGTSSSFWGGLGELAGAAIPFLF